MRVKKMDANWSNKCNDKAAEQNTAWSRCVCVCVCGIEPGDDASTAVCSALHAYVCHLEGKIVQRQEVFYFQMEIEPTKDNVRCNTYVHCAHCTHSTPRHLWCSHHPTHMHVWHLSRHITCASNGRQTMRCDAMLSTEIGLTRRILNIIN